MAVSRTGWPVMRRLHTVTVAAAGCTEADMWTSLAMLSGRMRGDGGLSYPEAPRLGLPLNTRRGAEGRGRRRAALRVMWSMLLRLGVSVGEGLAPFRHVHGGRAVYEAVGAAADAANPICLLARCIDDSLHRRSARGIY